MKKIYTLFLLFSLASYSLSAQLIINEVLFDPPNDIAGDANGDGTRSASADEFIEFINMSSTPLDISGYKIYDTTNYDLLPGTDTPRHTVPESTIIPANGMYVLFGGGTPTGISGDIVETSTTGNLNLSNSGDVITITDASGSVILTFDSSTTGLNFGANQSVTRSPDITGDFVLHTTANAALLFSPGSTTGVAPPLTLSPNTTDSFIFDPQAPLNRPPIEVFYHIPAGDITTMPILMAFHGADRDGGPHRDYWIAMANENGFIVIAPEFSSANYPGLGDNYLMANIFDDGDNPSPETFNSENEWTFSTLDPIFETVKAAISGTQEKYSAWGHSGGAQFLHRFVTYLPNSNLDVAVCSNAGWYTVPENGVSFPYGIDNGQLPTVDLTAAFSRKLIVHLGQNDNDPNSGLRRNDVVDAQQGVHRFERGQYYFNTSQATAQTMTVPFNWEKHELANVGHDPQLMANDALQYFLPNFLSTDSVEENEPIKIYPNPTKTGAVTISSLNNDVINIRVYDLLGKQVKNEILTNNTLNVSDLNTGVYIIKLTRNNATVTKKLVIN
ncbi:T9SS type A sorting domain-containing protein [uncultured Winogradskyella sp.]|uniref:T9SS type A sorting domain-containing protein n=3 Tax=Winogradskyella TaxID=286104 RepID=UPI0030D82AE4|tara:strand:+ start:1504 stop:3177 length:1674 start_codon:yes stop_codon:yes gene_type:complete